MFGMSEAPKDPSPFDPSAAARPDSGIFGLDDSEEAARVVLVPVPFDATTSYHRGTAAGPQAILAASHQVDLFDVQTGRPYAAGIHFQPQSPQVLAWNQAARAAADPVIAAAGIISGSDAATLSAQLLQVNQLSQQLELWVTTQTERLLQAGKLVGIVGGDHSVPLGAIKAHAQRYPGLGILHIDAHADLRCAYEGFTQSHASIMYNVMTQVPQVARLVQVGLRDVCEEEVDFIKNSSGRITAFFDIELASARADGEPWRKTCARIASELPQQVYVSFDIDGFERALCPHTGTPVPGGLLYNDVLLLLAEIVRSGRRIVGFDLTEVAPSPDPDNDWDANVGARILYKLIGFALQSATPAST